MDAGIVDPGNIGARAVPCLEFSASLSPLGRADERTRAADLLQLRVYGQWLLSVAEVCKPRIDKGFLVPSIAHYCRVLRPGQGHIRVNCSDLR
jgi:hypothetical protein